MKKLLTLTALLIAGSSSSVQATTYALYDDSFSIINGLTSTTVTTGVYETKWGTVTGTGLNAVFTPFFGADTNPSNSGYIDVTGPEFVANLEQTNNNAIAAGSVLALGITLLADDSSYSSSGVEAILTDPTWLAPTFVFLPGTIDAAFTANTVAVKGLYSFNGGNEAITLVTTAIPEPSTYAAIAGLAVLGVVASRRRRSV